MSKKKIKKFKVGIDSETYAISLVEAPAIESDFVALAKEEEEKHQVFLETNEKHLVYGAALIPDKDIYRNNGEQEFYINFTKESIEKMSQDFMKEYRQKEVTLDHSDVANEVCVVESWLVADSYKDKANALGINVPEGTWMVAMKVNNIDTWERIKAGELKGFSVESMISLEEFSKNDNNMEIETNDMFWDKLKNILKDTFSKKADEPQTDEVELEEQAPTVEPQNEPTVEPQEAPKVEEPTETKVEEKEAVVEPQNEPNEEPKVEEPNPLEEVVKNLQDELKALKDANSELQNKVKELGKKPSAKPLNTNAKPSAADTYSQWRSQMGKYLNGGY